MSKRLGLGVGMQIVRLRKLRLSVLVIASTASASLYALPVDWYGRNLNNHEGNHTWYRRGNVVIDRSKGHAKLWHVNKRLNDLVSRCNSNFKLRTSSSYYNQDMAELEVARVLSKAYGRNYVDGWAKSAQNILPIAAYKFGQTWPWSAEVPVPLPIGLSYDCRTGQNMTGFVNGSQVVLKKNAVEKGGWIVYTAYPSIALTYKDAQLTTPSWEFND